MGALLIVLMSQMATHWMNPIISAVMHPNHALWKRILTAPFRYVLGPAAKASVHYATAFLNWNAHALLRPCVRFFHGIAVLISEANYIILHLPAEVHWALYYLRHIAVPHLIHAAVAPVARLASDAKELALRIDHDATAAAGAIADTLTGLGWITGATFFGALRNLAHAFAHLWAYVYGEVTTKLGVLEREAIDLRRGIDDFGTRLGDLIAGKVATLERAVAGLLDTVDTDLKPFIDALRRGILPVAMLAAIVAALTAAWDGIFCRNTNAVGRHLCGLDTAMLDGFLLAITAEMTLGGLDELVHELQAVVGETASAVRALAEV